MKSGLVTVWLFGTCRIQVKFTKKIEPIHLHIDSFTTIHLDSVDKLRHFLSVSLTYRTQKI